MKLKINSKELQRVLATAFRAVPSKTTLPILECFLLKCEDGILKVTATDQALAISSAAEAEGEGSAAIHAKTLLDIVRTLPDSEISIDTNETLATIRWGNGHSSVPVFEVKDFPEVKQPEGEHILIDCALLRSAISHTIGSCATDELRPALTGICFANNDGKLDLVASDSHILSCFPTNVESCVDAFILPATAASVVRDSLSEGVCKVRLSGDTVFVEIGDLMISSRHIIGKFPDYRKIIPAGNPNILSGSRSSLMSTLKRVFVCANKSSKALKWTTDLAEVNVEAQDLGFQTAARETPENLTYEGNPLTIGINGDYIIRALGSFDCEEIALAFSDPNRAVLLYDPNGDDLCRIIVMPMAIK